MNVQITITTKNRRGEESVEIRQVTTTSHKRLTAHAATRLLHREFPELWLKTASKSKYLPKGVFSAWDAVPSPENTRDLLWKTFELVELV